MRESLGVKWEMKKSWCKKKKSLCDKKSHGVAVVAKVSFLAQSKQTQTSWKTPSIPCNNSLERPRE